MKNETEIESRTVSKMIEIFCRGRHQAREGLCEECEELLKYTRERLEKCPHKIKPKCSDCKIHCYEINKRTKIREVMKYSGPRMLIKHPILAVKHFNK